MKFNLAFLGPEWIFNLRRDFLLMLKYSLEDLGHRVDMSGAALDSSSINLIVGAYFLKPENILKIAESKLNYININTEVIANDMLNFNPEKVDFMGAYLPMMRRGLARWDVVPENLVEYDRYGAPAKFLRWGFQRRIVDITHKESKDLDFYFFGMMSTRRRRIIEKLFSAGFRGVVDHTCPYFVRNDRISRAKVNLNLVQDEKYSHVNSFRICYLANNHCHILSELENDPAGYLNYAEIFDIDTIVESVATSIRGSSWADKGRSVTEAFERDHPSREIIGRLLEETFAS